MTLTLLSATINLALAHADLAKASSGPERERHAQIAGDLADLVIDRRGPVPVTDASGQWQMVDLQLLRVLRKLVELK